MQGRNPATIHADIGLLFRLGALPEASDGDLLEQFAANRREAGEAAFEEIVRRHGAMVLGVCRRVTTDHQAAEDAFQATFLVLALRAGAIRKRESLGPWLHGVATRVARRGTQKSRRRRELHLVDDRPAGEDVSDPELGELRSVLDEELARLPDKYRRPVVLCYLEGLSQEEAARSLGWTKGTVSGRLARAKELLRGRLKRRGLVPASVLLGAGLFPETASASVAPKLVATTSRAAMALGLAGAEAGLASGHVIRLAHAVVRTMFLLRLQAAVPVLVGALGLAGFAYGLWKPREAAPNARAVTIRDPAPGRLLQQVVGVGFVRGGRGVVSADSDGLVRFWEASGGGSRRSVSLMGTPGAGHASLGGFGVSSDGRWMAGSGSVRGPDSTRTDRGVWIWSLDPVRLLHRIDTSGRQVDALAFSPEGASLATGDESGRIQLWDLATGEELLTLQLGEAAIRGIAFSPDGMTLAATNESSGVQLWDLGGGRPLGTFSEASQPGALGPCFSPDGSLIGFAAPQGEVTILDRSGRRPTLRKTLDVRGPLTLCFAPDGETLAVSAPLDGALTVLGTQDGRARWTTRLSTSSHAAGLAYAEDGRTIVLAGDAVPRFVDAGTGRVRPAP